MQFMMVEANKETEAGAMPREELLAAMTEYSGERMKAGDLVDLPGLRPAAKSARNKFSADKVTIVDGPFAETKEWIG